LTSLCRWPKAKFKLPCNLEESPYAAARVFYPCVIYENVNNVVFYLKKNRMALRHASFDKKKRGAMYCR
jgi:hypothetical protein